MDFPNAKRVSESTIINDMREMGDKYSLTKFESSPIIVKISDDYLNAYPDLKDECPGGYAVGRSTYHNYKLLEGPGEDFHEAIFENEHMSVPMKYIIGWKHLDDIEPLLNLRNIDSKEEQEEEIEH